MNSVASHKFSARTQLSVLLLAGTMLGAPVMAQQVAPPVVPAPAPEAAPTATTVKSITVVGNQRLEAQTILSYLRLRVGQQYDRSILDQALKDLAATELFKDFQITDNAGALTIQVTENPVINRVILEGNKRLKEDKVRPEIKLAPRQIFTRSKVRADVARIIELYKRQGRFAATVEPKMVSLDQNRVDVVFEINEGPKSKVRQINIIGNEKFSDGDLKDEMATKQSSLMTILSSNTSYDPDRLAYDQQKLRLFYLTNGYADFRVISAVAELTSNKQDFIITYVVEEGERYKFGDIDVKSEIRDFQPEMLKKLLPMKTGDWYDAKQVEDTVESLSETAGLFGYAFADINPEFRRDPETRTMAITFNVAESPRTYVERIDVNGNTLTHDKVVRREFRLNEGDAFNSFGVKRTENRINSLGYFQENLEIERKEGSAPDRIILETNVEEKPTGELSLSAGFSSIENFLLQASIRQRNFRGLGQQLQASVNYSSYSKSIELGFTEPYLFDRNISVGGSIYRRDLNSFNFINNDRRTTFQQVTTGAQINAGVPLTEFMSFFARYSINFDDVTLDKGIYYFGGECDPLVAGRYLCDAIGNRTTSLLGYTLAYDDRDNRIRPTRGQSLSLSQDFAGLGGSVKYVRTRLNGSKHFNLGSRFILNLSAEGGYIYPFGGRPTPTSDKVRLTDRFFLGEPQMRGFDIRGVGPRVIRYSVDNTDPANPIVVTDANGERGQIDDALGGRAYYQGRIELDIPLGTGAKEMGLRPSIFVDVGSVFSVRRPTLTTLANFRETDPNAPGFGLTKSLCRNATTGVTQFATETVTTPTGGVPTGTGQYTTCPTDFSRLDPFEERFFGDTWMPRVSIGAGVNWNSPFGPFRIDFAYALRKEEGDDTKRFSFNVGTQF
ncbi:MAG: outer membrane protein assembly factor BamA [Sphingopyxis sp.]|jgi:outer membrane protein insertion porin family|uniref:outer membrane protein assembly factor BamA n=1 Tax=unclassified Sphingopyxis TaxID=2614943 RepID=UPI000730F1B0|nr:MULTISPECIES: outer membrane protein assembly factor BamA [unclassified Sphingopyxis]KTD99486.1 outer membrane protein assembly factor BamA [Sphingopyxis sp. H012]KTE07807.1 outer membrane protein assembly factor BamA [Sphingopyxis sp. H093]KTE13667.1 outer membrane protein assembly factor BamA [Sphingopyxis sp. H053]KTE30966.1 outer membrane protein assembly factor BamA [Sphingopyxis sp. H080]KTE37241.1 outer membrane protein assembly factor BamA [Sphingopyxis sp. H038]